MKRPGHATVVAYLALFVALATGSAWAAVEIKSSKQIKKGVVRGSDIRDENLTGRDIRAGSIDGSEIADRSLTGSDLGLDALGAAEIDEDSLGLAKGVSQTIQTSKSIDDGGFFSAPRIPEGNLLQISIPAGRHFVTAHVSVGADDNGSGVVCVLDTGMGNGIDSATSVSGVDYGATGHTPDAVSASVVVSSPSAFSARFSCADAGGGAIAYDRTLSAISLAG